MLYLAYQTHTDIMVPVRMFAEAGLNALAPWAAAEDLKVLRNLTAAYELITRAGLTHARPSYGIDNVRVGNREVAVREEPVAVTPFGTLLRFQEGCGHRPAAGFGGGTALGALCHTVAQSGAHAAAGPRCLHHRLAQCT